MIKKNELEDCDKCRYSERCDEGDIMLRGCRLKHAFPNATTRLGGGLLLIDPKKALDEANLRRHRR